MTLIMMTTPEEDDVKPPPQITQPIWERSKEHFRHAILVMYDAKKSSRQAHQFLSQVYGDACPSYSNFKFWYKRFDSGDFDVKDKERSGQPRKFTDHDLETLLNENPSRSLKELADALHVSKSAVSERLHALGRVSKSSSWVVCSNKKEKKKRKSN